MRTLAIVNPKSGSSDDLSDVASTIRHHPAMGDPDIRITGERDDACLLARAGVDRGFRRIFAVGGDGTLNEVVNGLMTADEELRSKVVLGVLPLGTGNDFARTLDLPLNLQDALDGVEDLVPRRIDVIRVELGEEKYCVNVSAGGFSGRVDDQVTSETKKSWGPLAYLRGAFDLLPDPEAYLVELTLDGGEPTELEALNIVVANGRTVAGGIPVAPDARLDDGLLDLVILRLAPMSRLASFGSRCLVGKHLDHELTEYRRVESVSVRSNPEMPFNLDGERVGSSPISYRVLPGALQMLTGRDSQAFEVTVATEEG